MCQGFVQCPACQREQLHEGSVGNLPKGLWGLLLPRGAVRAGAGCMGTRWANLSFWDSPGQNDGWLCCLSSQCSLLGSRCSVPRSMGVQADFDRMVWKINKITSLLNELKNSESQGDLTSVLTQLLGLTTGNVSAIGCYVKRSEFCFVSSPLRWNTFLAV